MGKSKKTTGSTTPDVTTDAVAAPIGQTLSKVSKKTQKAAAVKKTFPKRHKKNNSGLEVLLRKSEIKRFGYRSDNGYIRPAAYDVLRKYSDMILDFITGDVVAMLEYQRKKTVTAKQMYVCAAARGFRVL